MFTLFDVAAGLIAIMVIVVCLYSRQWRGVLIGTLALIVNGSFYLSGQGQIPELISIIAAILLIAVACFLMIESWRIRRKMSR